MLHEDLTFRIEKLIGAKIQSHTRVAGGYTPAMRLLCKTTTASFFVKVGATPLTSEYLRREICVYTYVSGEFMPKLVAWEDHDSEPILVIEDLSAHHWPPPWNERQVGLVLAQIEAMHNTKVQLEPYAQVHGTRGSNWQTIAADPEPFLSLGMASQRWLDVALPALIHHEAVCRTDGNSLAHWDLRSDNICLAEDRAAFVDWNLACLSNPKLDLGFWLPSLAYEGGPEPEKIMPDAPDIAAWVSGFFAARAGLPGIPDAPRVRLVQRQQLGTALPWAVRALDLPPLKRR
ncbi:MAG: aminoglycoside phosphotransferase family protein [Chloroflexi bacterium]|nr:aminoglycoside phosphotransferase family protein [Chloroflexota bacterium]MCI0578418.1 aminoglycoside phosphotransferase family protein [Chloroflexota bacterium]MCI0648158.1 aminoglycoside phosphotransferase family protein [Chloroflexota bacterium]MCI0726673.1 aminoglycoside phosphotransferase family protein [Chloroflexota bacterium]